jgi:Uma2 family endonuclease
MSKSLIDTVSSETIAVPAPLSTRQYHSMIEMGVLEEGVAIELVDGLLVRKDRRDSEGDVMTVGKRHVHVVKRLIRLLNAGIPAAVGHVQSQQPVTLSEWDEPEPDVAVVLGHEDDYMDHLPTGAETPLVIEVADSSVAFDLGRKQELYRDCGIAEYWVVDLRDDEIEVFRGPLVQQWREHSVYRRGQSIETAVAGHAVVLSVDEVLGPAV